MFSKGSFKAVYNPYVGYFDQCLGGAHFKHWTKYALSTFFAKKAEKGRKCKKIDAIFAKECFLSLHENAG